MSDLHDCIRIASSWKIGQMIGYNEREIVRGLIEDSRRIGELIHALAEQRLENARLREQVEHYREVISSMSHCMPLHEGERDEKGVYHAVDSLSLDTTAELSE
jgi:hypothetical protein